MILLNVNGENRLNNYAAFVANRYQWVISAGGPWKCDDDTSDNLSTGDFWKVYVRWNTPSYDNFVM